MKAPAAALLALAVLAAAWAQEVPPDFGTEDISELLRDRTLVQREIQCLLEKGPCDKLGSNLKAAAPEVLHNKCGRCTPRQRQNARLLVGFLQKNHPDVLATIKDKYPLRR